MSAVLTGQAAVADRGSSALDPDETAAVVRCQSGDRSAFDTLVRRHMRRASSFALGWTGDREEALDLSQEAFIRAYRAIGSFDVSRPFYPWFHRILRNVCLTRVARRGRLREVPLEDRLEEVEAGGRGPVGHDPQAALERLELRCAVWDALRRLSPADSEILILREFQELSYAEIAAVLDVPPGTVMSRLHAARRRLRGLLEPQISPASGGTARATGNTDGRNGHD